MPQKTYPTEFKIEVVKYYKCHHSVTETLERYGIAESTLFRWKREYESRRFLRLGKSGESDKRAPLQSHVTKMEQIVEVLSICKCGVNASNDEKMEAIKELEGQYSIHVLCEALQFPRGPYYNRKRRENNPTTSELRDEEIKPLIKQIFEQSNGRFGRKPIKYKLLEMGYRVHENRITRLMRDMGLEVQMPTFAKEHLKPLPRNKYPNILNRDFNPTAPNMSWVTDITYAKVNNKYMFICVIIDLYSRKVISYGISDNIDTILTLATFDKAFNERGKPKDLLLHSDQGVQYTAYAFRSRLKKLKVRQSFSKPGVPYDNSVCESFFHRLKNESIYRNLYSTADELSLAVDEYIDFYNNYRPHRSLKMKTPSQYETEYYRSEV